MADTHTYDVAIEWTGNLGSGTDSYRSFSRAHEVFAAEKTPIAGSSDAAFRGDPARWNTGGGGQLTEVTLRPQVTVADAAMVDKAHELHDEVPAVCFIARSVNFPIRHEPQVRPQ